MTYRWRAADRTPSARDTDDLTDADAGVSALLLRLPLAVAGCSRDDVDDSDLVRRSSRAAFSMSSGTVAVRSLSVAVLSVSESLRHSLSMWSASGRQNMLT